jgi:hypothetical protein
MKNPDPGWRSDQGFRAIARVVRNLCPSASPDGRKLPPFFVLATSISLNSQIELKPSAWCFGVRGQKTSKAQP